MRRYYPQLLVTLQFGLILLITLYVLLGSSFSLFGTLLFSVGATIGIWAIRHNRPNNFNIVPELKEGCCLVTTGIYRYIRHPMYTSVMLMMLGLLLFKPDLLNTLMWGALVIVLYLKASREESLWIAHDPTYATYQKQTKYFIPYIL